MNFVQVDRSYYRFPCGVLSWESEKSSPYGKRGWHVLDMRKADDECLVGIFLGLRDAKRAARKAVECSLSDTKKR